MPPIDSSVEGPIEGALTAQNTAVCAMLRTGVKLPVGDSRLDYFIIRSFNVMDGALCINMK